jgi:hypothetical protein
MKTIRDALLNIKTAHGVAAGRRVSVGAWLVSQSFLVDDVHGVLGAQDPIHRHLAEAAAAVGKNISLITLKTNTVIINKSNVVAVQNTSTYSLLILLLKYPSVIKSFNDFQISILYM